MAALALAPVVYLGWNLGRVWAAGRAAYTGSAQAIIVLGAAQYDGQPSPVLQRRLDQAARLFQEGRAPFIVVTGGAREGDRTTEAKAGYDYLRRTYGLADEQLMLEVGGRSTYQSLAASARFLARRGVTEVILVSDPFHAERVRLVALEVGLDPRVVPTPTPSPPDRLLREAVAVAAGRLVGFGRLDRWT
jgi:uncharacterized SAM-binding protein YcdF (DUF218 family)